MPAHTLEAEAARAPRFSCCLIVFNAELFLHACLESIYDFAHQILIVEGSCPEARWDASPAGTSRDGTLAVIERFPDPAGKIRLVGSRAWSHKDEMVNAYVPFVTGDYLFQVDSDELWTAEALERLRVVLREDPSITCLEFRPLQFWHNFQTVLVEGHWEEPFMRVFRFEAGARWRSHEPPVLLDPHGRAYNSLNKVDATRRFGITFFHYNYLTADQAQWKCRFFRNYYTQAELPSSDSSTRIGMTHDWFEKVWLAWREEPARVEQTYGTTPGGGPAWRPLGKTARYLGPHPPAIRRHPLWKTHKGITDASPPRSSTGQRRRKIVHFAYSGDPMADDTIRAPGTITNHLFRFLEQRVDVRYYDWADRHTPVDVAPDDVVLGHPHPAEGTVMRRLFAAQSAGRYLIWPMHTRLPEINRYAKELARAADALFLISGPFWTDTLARTEYATWHDKIVRLDNAVAAERFPLEKAAFNAPGCRGLFVFGRSGVEKGTRELFQLLTRTTVPVLVGGDYTASDLQILAGRPDTQVLGRIDWRDPQTRARVLGSCDFFVNMSLSDASPTALLECMALGLIPVTTPECGYHYPSFLLLSHDDTEHSLAVLRSAQQIPERRLRRLQQDNRRLVEDVHTWPRFCESVWRTLAPRLGCASSTAVHGDEPTEEVICAAPRTRRKAPDESTKPLAIVVAQHGSSNHDPVQVLGDSLQQLGWNVVLVPAGHLRDEPSFDERFQRLLRHSGATAMFSVTFAEVLARVSRRTAVPYVAWYVDPHDDEGPVSADPALARLQMLLARAGLPPSVATTMSPDPKPPRNATAAMEFVPARCIRLDGSAADDACFSAIATFLSLGNPSWTLYGDAAFIQRLQRSPALTGPVEIVDDPIRAVGTRSRRFFICGVSCEQMARYTKNVLDAVPDAEIGTVRVLEAIAPDCIPRDAYQPVQPSIYPVFVPEIRVAPALDFLLLDLPAGYSLLRVGTGYVHEILKGMRLRHQTLDMNMILYHRFHMHRIKDHPGPLRTSGGYPMPDDPWGALTVEEWRNPMIVEHFRPAIEELLSEIERASPAVVGLSLHMGNRLFAREVARGIRQRSPSTVIVVGGFDCVHRELGPQVFEEFDYMVIGEAERTLPPLLESILKGEPPGPSPGVITRFGPPNGSWENGPLEDDLDRLPFPKYDWAELPLYRNWNGDFTANIAINRGCRWSRCAFCNECFPWRRRSAENVADEIQWWTERGCRSCCLSVSDAIGDSVTLLDIGREIIRRGLKIEITTQLRVDRRSTQDFFRTLREAGFRHLSFGVDGWTDRLLRIQNKGYNMALVAQNLRDARAAGIRVSVNIVIGVPGETDGDVEESVRNIVAMKDDIAAFNSIYPTLLAPGSRYYKDPAAYKIRFRGDRDDICRRYPDRIPPELWYSEDPYIDQSIRIQRILHVCRQLVAHQIRIDGHVMFAVRRFVEEWTATGALPRALPSTEAGGARGAKVRWPAESERRSPAEACA